MAHTRNAGRHALRFAAMLKAAREFGLDQEVVNAVAVRFDPRCPDLDWAAEALAGELLVRRRLDVPDAP